MELTLEEKSTIQRMLGKIEGVAFVVEDKIATPLLDAIEVIDCILDEVRRTTVASVDVRRITNTNTAPTAGRRWREQEAGCNDG